MFYNVPHAVSVDWLRPGCCWNMVFALHGRVCTCIDKLQTVSNDNGFLKCFWAHVLISFIQSCWFLIQPRSLFAEISTHYLNHLMTLGIVDGEIPKFLATVYWQIFFLNNWTLCPCSFSQIGEPRPIFACEPFEDANHNTITCYHLTCLPGNVPNRCLKLFKLVWNKF